MKKIKRNFDFDYQHGTPPIYEAENIIDQTIQNDVPSLKEIVNRFALTGEVIGVKPMVQYSDPNTYEDLNVIQPDVEDMNISYQKLEMYKNVKNLTAQQPVAGASPALDDEQNIKSVNDKDTAD